MEARTKRNIKSGSEYDDLFPKSEGTDKKVKGNADVNDTVAFIPKVVHETLDQTKDISKKLKGSNVYGTCSNIWHFVYHHINYKKDQEGYEQIRSPARVWKDRFSGVDCYCYSTFISSVLTNLSIPHKLRITKYWKDYYQHIYPVVQNGAREIILDCVTDKFNYEVPYSEKKDYSMDLQYLNGFDGDGTEELGKILKKAMSKKSSAPMTNTKKAAPKGLFQKLKAKKAATSNGTSSPDSYRDSPSSVPAVKKKKKGLVKKVVSKINKVNPATILLRNGVLASMKLNIKNVAKRLRWSYLTPEQAKAKGILPDKFQKLVATRQKLENIFTVAGGKTDNLKKAILGGKGNKDKAVNGLGLLGVMDYTDYMNQYTPLDQLLGRETYYEENIEGLGQLGEPLTLTAIAAAAGVVAGIVGSLKQIGDIFGGGKKESADFDESKTDAPENNVDTSSVDPGVVHSTSNGSSAASSSVTPPSTDDDYSRSNSQSNQVTTTSSPSGAGDESSSNDDSSDDNSDSAITKSDLTVTNAITKTDVNTPDSKTPDQSFWEKNKSWLKPAAIGVGGVTLIAVGVHLMKGGKASNKSSSHSLSGLPHKKKKKHQRKAKGKRQKAKGKHRHKHPVALL
jgi:hypothetical protein